MADPPWSHYFYKSMKLLVFTLVCGFVSGFISSYYFKKYLDNNKPDLFIADEIAFCKEPRKVNNGSISHAPPGLYSFKIMNNSFSKKILFVKSTVYFVQEFFEGDEVFQKPHVIRTSEIDYLPTNEFKKTTESSGTPKLPTNQYRSDKLCIAYINVGGNEIIDGKPVESTKPSQAQLLKNYIDKVKAREIFGFIRLVIICTDSDTGLTQPFIKEYKFKEGKFNIVEGNFILGLNDPNAKNHINLHVDHHMD